MTARGTFAALRALAYATGLAAIWLSVAISPLFLGLYLLLGLLLNEVARRIRCESCGNRVFKNKQLMMGWAPKECPTCRARL